MRSDQAEEQAEEEETEENLDDDAVEEVPVSITVQASRGILRSILRFFVINSIKLLLVVTIGLVSFNTYQYETSDASKLYEITMEQAKEFITSEKRYEDIDTLKTFILNSYAAIVAWDDIFVELFVAKIIFVILLIVIMSSTSDFICRIN